MRRRVVVIALSSAIVAGFAVAARASDPPPSFAQLRPVAPPYIVDDEGVLPPGQPASYPITDPNGNTVGFMPADQLFSDDQPVIEYPGDPLPEIAGQ